MRECTEPAIKACVGAFPEDTARIAPREVFVVGACVRGQVTKIQRQLLETAESLHLTMQQLLAPIYSQNSIH